MSGFRSCSVPDFNTACDLRKHKSLFRDATYDVPKQGYLRRQTTDYRRLARIQGSFSNKHPLAHSPRKATSNYDPKIQHHARKNPFCDATRHADSHLRKTMTAHHSPHALSPPAHYAAARDNALLLPRPLPYPRTPRQLSSTHRAPYLHTAHDPTRGALACTQRTTFPARTTCTVPVSATVKTTISTNVN